MTLYFQVAASFNLLFRLLMRSLCSSFSKDSCVIFVKKNVIKSKLSSGEEMVIFEISTVNLLSSCL